MRLTERRAGLIRLGIVNGQLHLTARREGFHFAAFGLLLGFRGAWGSDTLPRRAFERTVAHG